MKKEIINILLRPMITTHAEDSISEAAKLMNESGIHHLPVIEDGKVIGLLSDRDIQRATKLETQTKVCDFMSQPVICREVQVPLSEVVQLMISERISCVVITQNGAPMGIVTSTDLLKALVQQVGDDKQPKVLGFETARAMLLEPINGLIGELSCTGI